GRSPSGAAPNAGAARPPSQVAWWGARGTRRHVLACAGTVREPPANGRQSPRTTGAEHRESVAGRRRCLYRLSLEVGLKILVSAVQSRPCPPFLSGSVCSSSLSDCCRVF